MSSPVREGGNQLRSLRSRSTSGGVLTSTATLVALFTRAHPLGHLRFIHLEACRRLVGWDANRLDEKAHPPAACEGCVRVGVAQAARLATASFHLGGLPSAVTM